MIRYIRLHPYVNRKKPVDNKKTKDLRDSLVGKVSLGMW